MVKNKRYNMKLFYDYTYKVPKHLVVGTEQQLTIEVSYCVVDGDVMPYQVMMTLATLARIKDPYLLDKDIREETRKHALQAAA